MEQNDAREREGEIGAIVSSPLFATSRSTPIWKSGRSMPKKPPSFSPTTSWPVSPWIATAPVYDECAGLPNAHTL